MKRLWVLASALLVVWACSEGLPTESRSGEPGTNWERFRAADSLTGKCTLVPPTSQSHLGDCQTVDATVTPTNLHCGSPNHQCLEQKDPIHFVFSHPAYEVDIQTHGNYWCSSADKGVASYYSAGHLVETGKLALTDSIGECLASSVANSVDGTPGIDSMAQHASYVSQYKGQVDSIVITRPYPDTIVTNWPPFIGVFGELEIWDVTATYAFNLFQNRPATAQGCLTGNDVLDQQVVRDLFRTLWDSSMTSLPPNQRTERGGWIYQDPTTGGLVTVITPPYSLTDSPCTSYYEPPEAGGNIPIAHVHTHPFLKGEAVTCPAINGSPATSGTWDPQKSGAPSGADIKNIAANHIQEFILDSTEVYMVPPNVTARNSRGVTKPKHRHQSNPSCDLF